MTQMKKLLIPLALASGIFSQGNNETRSLDDLLISENQTLGSFRSAFFDSTICAVRYIANCIPWPRNLGIASR